MLGSQPEQEEGANQRIRRRDDTMVMSCELIHLAGYWIQNKMNQMCVSLWHCFAWLWCRRCSCCLLTTEVSPTFTFTWLLSKGQQYRCCCLSQSRCRRGANKLAAGGAILSPPIARFLLAANPDRFQLSFWRPRNKRPGKKLQLKVQ